MTPETRDRFEERLLTQLRAQVARNAPDPEPAPTPRRHRLLRPTPIAVAGGALAAAAVAVVLATGGDGADPAYAVTPQTDGSVTVSVKSLSDASGLEDALRDAGVNAVVRTVPEGKMCEPAAPAQLAEPGEHHVQVGGTTRKGGASTFTVSAEGIADGNTLLIATSGDGGDGPSSISMAMVDSANPTCTLVDAPSVPAAAGVAPVQGSSFQTSGSAGGTQAGPTTSVGP